VIKMQEIDYGICPICGKPLQKWYNNYGGERYIGCSDIKCNYKREIKE